MPKCDITYGSSSSAPPIIVLVMFKAHPTTPTPVKTTECLKRSISFLRLLMIVTFLLLQLDDRVILLLLLLITSIVDLFLIAS